MAARSVSHFSHPTHELKFRKSYTLPHWCEMCGDRLPGGGYSCRDCGVHVHEECVQHPDTLTSFLHPRHDLTLSRADAPHFCDICLADVPAGRFLYRCAPCGFAAHPGCARQLLPAARSELHPEHELNVVASVGRCAACAKPCYLWFYRCGLCGVDLHIACLRGANPSAAAAGGKVAGIISDVGGEGGSGRNDNGSLVSAFVKHLEVIGMEFGADMIAENL